MSNITHRIKPLLEKLSRRAPLCPLRSATTYFNPKTLRVYPPKQSIETLKSTGGIKLLEFNGKHQFWFPDKMLISPELWSEYLVAFWDHPLNFHQYVRSGVVLNEKDVVIDCGACEGFFTKKALEAGAAKVICVEPSPTMTGCLRATFANEIKEGRVVVAPVALGSFSGSAGFACADDDAFAGHFESNCSNEVEVMTLSELARKHGTPTFIKMDLEGSEYQALAGGLDLLFASHPKLGITTYHNPWDYAVISSLLIGAGYGSVKPYGVTLRDSQTPRPVMVHAY
jgi:FkbM family methyltransferase